MRLKSLKSFQFPIVSFYDHCRLESWPNVQAQHAPIAGRQSLNSGFLQLSWFPGCERYIKLIQWAGQPFTDCFDISLFARPAVEERLCLKSFAHGAQRLYFGSRKEALGNLGGSKVLLDPLDVHSQVAT